MPSLRETQIAMSAAVRSGSPESATMLLLHDAVGPAQRLQIYRNNHQLGARAALGATYPVIERLGGGDWFAQTAARYIGRHPSTSGDLEHLGGHFPGHLGDELADTPYAYFADVAALEWAHQCVSTAEDRPPFDVDTLRKFSPDEYDRLLFVPRPALRIVESRYPVLAIWRANQPDADEPCEPITLDGLPTQVLLIRRTNHVELRNVSAGGSRLLGEFLLGRPLGVAASATSSAVDAFDLDAALAEVVGLEAIAAVEVLPAPDEIQITRRIP